MMLQHIRHALSRVTRRNRYLSTFVDGYASFAEAASAACGYDDVVINQNAFTAASEVLAGRAAFERDGVLFTEPDPRIPVVDALRQAVRVDGSLRVLDIGGGLGSSYWQNIQAIGADQVVWTVVERRELVELAANLAPHPVVYRTDLEAALMEPWDCILLSSMLQYVPEPHALLTQVGTSTARWVVVDRTPVYAGAADVACVQHTPAHIYSGSYPAWIFASGSLEADLAGWKVTHRFPGIEPRMGTESGIEFTWEGFTAMREAA